MDRAELFGSIIMNVPCDTYGQSGYVQFVLDADDDDSLTETLYIVPEDELLPIEYFTRRANDDAKHVFYDRVNQVIYNALWGGSK